MEKKRILNLKKQLVGFLESSAMMAANVNKIPNAQQEEEWKRSNVIPLKNVDRGLF